MRSLKLIGLAVLLALGAGATGYALAARPTAHAAATGARTDPTECAVPEVVSAPDRHLATVVRHEEPASEVLVGIRSSHEGRDEREPVGDGGIGLRARRLTIAHAIEDREPVDELTVVDDLLPGDRLYAFIDMANTGEASQVQVTFRHESGLTVGRISLDVPAHVSRHRTWAYSTHVDEPGNWTAEVRDESGRLLSLQNFEVR